MKEPCLSVCLDLPLNGEADQSRIVVWSHSSAHGVTQHTDPVCGYGNLDASPLASFKVLDYVHGRQQQYQAIGLKEGSGD